jgi:hypothetical protein
MTDLKIDMFKVHEKRYAYLEPIWTVLENNPEGIELVELVEKSGLDREKMLKTIEKLAIEYHRVSQAYLSKGMIYKLVEKAMGGEKPDEELKKRLANSWVFDKVMLYARCKELDWTTEVAYPEEMLEMKKIWLETKGM